MIRLDFNQVTSALQERDNDLFHAFVRLFRWPIRFYNLDSFRVGTRQLEISVTHTHVKMRRFSIEPIALLFTVCPAAGAGYRVLDGKIEKHSQIRLQAFSGKLNNLGN